MFVSYYSSEIAYHRAVVHISQNSGSHITEQWFAYHRNRILQSIGSFLITVQKSHIIEHWFVYNRTVVHIPQKSHITKQYFISYYSSEIAYHRDMHMCYFKYLSVAIYRFLKIIISVGVVVGDIKILHFQYVIVVMLEQHNQQWFISYYSSEITFHRDMRKCYFKNLSVVNLISSDSFLITVQKSHATEICINVT